jgi:hypothetical protein
MFMVCEGKQLTVFLYFAMLDTINENGKTRWTEWTIRICRAALWFANVPINHDIIRVGAEECLFGFENILCAHFSTLDWGTYVKQQYKCTVKDKNSLSCGVVCGCGTLWISLVCGPTASTVVNMI